MTEKGRKYLYDILIAINLIEDFIADTHNFELFAKDPKTQSAVERVKKVLSLVSCLLNLYSFFASSQKTSISARVISFRLLFCSFALASRILKPFNELLVCPFQGIFGIDF